MVQLKVSPQQRHLENTICKCLVRFHCLVDLNITTSSQSVLLRCRPPITTTTAFLAEAFGTALLAFVVFALTHPRNHKDVPQKAFVPALIGSFVGGLIVVIAPLTQAGFNPARDFGPRLVAYLAGWRTIAFQGWWVYVVAPIVGAPIGAFLADKVLYADPAC